jgi:hypothetical protein
MANEKQQQIGGREIGEVDALGRFHLRRWVKLDDAGRAVSLGEAYDWHTTPDDDAALAGGTVTLAEFRARKLAELEAPDVPCLPAAGGETP